MKDQYVLFLFNYISHILPVGFTFGRVIFFRDRIFMVSLFSSERAPLIKQISIPFLIEIQEQGDGKLKLSVF